MWPFVGRASALRPQISEADKLGLLRFGDAVEQLGLTYHRTPAQQARDRRRDQILTAAGLPALRFTNVQVRRDEPTVIATLQAVVRNQLSSSR